MKRQHTGPIRYFFLFIALISSPVLAQSTEPAKSSTSFEILFSVELKHEFSRLSLSIDRLLKPDTPTNRLLRKHKILIKPIGNKIYAFAPANLDMSALASNADHLLNIEYRSDDLFWDRTDSPFGFETVVFSNRSSMESPQKLSREFRPKENGNSPDIVLSIDLRKILVKDSKYIAELDARRVIVQYVIPFQRKNLVGRHVEVSITGTDSELFSKSEINTPGEDRVFLFDSGTNLLPIGGSCEVFATVTLDDSAPVSMQLPCAGMPLTLLLDSERRAFIAKMIIEWCSSIPGTGLSCKIR